MGKVEAITDLTPYLLPEIAEEFSKTPIADISRVKPEDFKKLRERNTVPATPAPEGMVIENLVVPGLEDGDPEVPIRVYRSEESSKDLMVYVHGGGFVRGDLNSADPLCLDFVRTAGCNVVSVDYRLSPEAVFPAAVNDSYAALCWGAEGPTQLGGIPERIAISGGSAGGCIAAGVALMARDLDGPKLCHQLLMAPVLDDRHETVSAQAIQDLRTWCRQKSITCWKFYLGEDHDGPVSPYASPARAESLAELPPSTLIVKEMDLLRDEAVEYATRLTSAGVQTSLIVYAGTCHAPEPAGSAIRKRMTRDLREIVSGIFD